MTQDRELAACPFCGGEPRLRIPQATDGYAIHISCRCGVEMYGARGHFATGDEAIAAWNRRTPAGEDRVAVPLPPFGQLGVP